MIISIIKIILIFIISVLSGIAALITIPFNKNGKVFHYLARLYAKGILLVSGVKVRTVGVENLQSGKSYIYVSNHASGFDIPAVIAGIPDQIRIVYKKELGKIPIWGWALKYNRTYIPIDRSSGADAIKSLDEAAEKMKSGASVLLFAEGTRTKDGKLQPFKRGAFNLAVKSGVPVIPLTINGSFKILPKKKFRILPGQITLVLGKPIDVKIDGGKQEEIRLMDEVYKVISNNYIEQ
ncbi:MAG: 1-acyl-sn-glycerol-3-phosphate acyltransferase [Ignavibacteriae bacterium]|nr:MAG: 1-acyl-sn-glycerol-3-phosphate acyltransferase [Ignavibacteriota bacterium]